MKPLRGFLLCLRVFVLHDGDSLEDRVETLYEIEFVLYIYPQNSVAIDFMPKNKVYICKIILYSRTRSVEFNRKMYVTT